MTSLLPGAIVVVDWRRDHLPKEPGGLRPAVVVQETDLFPDEYPNVLVVPMTTDEGLAHPAFATPIPPHATNGGKELCWALGHHLASVSTQRVTTTPSKVTADQLAAIRRTTGLAIGLVAP